MSKVIGNFIKQRLKEMGMSQKSLAESLYVTPQAVSLWIAGENEPAKALVPKINEVLKCDLFKLYLKEFNTNMFKDKENKIDYEINYEECLKDGKIIENMAEAILNNSLLATKYSKPTITLINWLLIGVMYISFYKKDVLNKQEGVDESLADIIGDYLSETFEKQDMFVKKDDFYKSDLDYEFYLIGMDLFEHDIPKPYDQVCSIGMSYWNAFESAFPWHSENDIHTECKICLVELVDYVYRIRFVGGEFEQA